MADGQVAFEGCERPAVEHLGDETHVLDDGDGLAVAHRDAGRLLTAVLQREEPQVREVRHLLARGVDPEDATGLADAAIRHHSSIPRGSARTVSA